MPAPAEDQGEARRRQGAHHSAHDGARRSGIRTARRCPRSSSWKCCSASCRSSSRTRPNCARSGARRIRARSFCRDSPRRASAMSNWPRCRRSSMPRRATCSTCWRMSPMPYRRCTREERAAQAQESRSAPHFNSKQQAFLDFVLSHYVRVGVEELDQEKLTPLLRLKYHELHRRCRGRPRAHPRRSGRFSRASRSILYEPRATA